VAPNGHQKEEESMLSRTVRPLLLAVAVLALGAAPAGALGFSYGNVAGTTVDFLNVAETTSGADPLFEAPVGVGDGLLFFPTVFAADSATQPSVSSTLTMNIKAHAGLFLEKVTIEAVGDYSILGTGTASIAASLDATDVSPGTNGIFNDVAVVTPGSPFTSGFGEYSGVATIDLTGLGITEISISYVNTLQAAAQGGSAFIQNKVFNGPQVSATAGPAVPEPTAALVFGVGCLLVGARLRRAPRR
jgi:hypothetical protein